LNGLIDQEIISESFRIRRRCWRL